MSNEITARSIVAGTSTTSGQAPFTAFNPADGSALEPTFLSATLDDLDRAVAAASDATPILAETSGELRGRLLRSIADGIDAQRDALVERAHLETALPHPRLIGEVGRTSGQLRLFAKLVEEGSWVDARIDLADPARTPPKPDLRSMLRPLGPVAVFGASNFPLAFSVAGGDTASGLAAGCPVIVKAHPAHPGTGELVGHIIAAAVAELSLPAGIFSLLFDSGHAIGSALVQHPGIRAVGFTGSFRGGQALLKLAAQRPDPIPVYAEMGSSNPVFLLPEALATRGTDIATNLRASFTLGGGQFCTKPGIVFATSSDDFLNTLREGTAAAPAFPLLTQGIASAFAHSVAERSSLSSSTGAASSNGFSAQTTLLEAKADDFLAQPELSEEIFGPATLLIHCGDPAQLLQAAHNLGGHLTATVHGTESDLRSHAELLRVLATKVGRLVINGFPTGVEVGSAMVHGGPWPATSDGRSTSVGSQAIFRFTRPVSYQGMPQFALPPELQDANPLQILRSVNGARPSTDPVA
jgi:alpha-ketoglutaric semialdehyde dehydrogenase